LLISLSLSIATLPVKSSPSTHEHAGACSPRLLQRQSGFLTGALLRLHKRLSLPGYTRCDLFDPRYNMSASPCTACTVKCRHLVHHRDDRRGETQAKHSEWIFNATFYPLNMFQQPVRHSAAHGKRHDTGSLRLPDEADRQNRAEYRLILLVIAQVAAKLHTSQSGH